MRHARVVVALRYLLLPAWIAGAVWLGLNVAQPASGESDVLSMVPEDAAALRVQRDAAELFQPPFGTDAVVVQRRSSGLTPEEQVSVYRRAATADVAARDGTGPALSAVPVTNTLGVIPGAKEEGTAALTYLTFPADTTLVDRVAEADRYAANVARDQDGGFVGVTGVAPANLREGMLIEDSLALIEVATILLVLAVIGLLFRSVVAPLLAVGTVGLAYVVALSALRLLGEHFSVALPENLRPLMIALTMGVITDYCIFYLTGMRSALARGDGRLDAARAATASTTPIVLASGLILAAGLAALRVASIDLFRELGPALALTVLISTAVSITFLPAALAALGRYTFWPRRIDADEAPPAEPGRMASFAVRKPVALLVVVACVAGLAVAAMRAGDTPLGFSPIDGLPADSAERQAADQAELGFAPGMLAPTQLVLRMHGIAGREPELGRLEQAIGDQPGVAGVIGPRLMPVAEGSNLAFSQDGDAARMLVIFDSDPHGAAAIDRLDELAAQMPALLDGAELGDARVGYAGETAIARESIDRLEGDSARVAAVVLAVNLLMLMVFLRALVAPFLLVAASALAVLAALGLTALAAEWLFGTHELTYFIPFTAGVLLVSLGSDYNVYVAGRVWQEAGRRPLPEAVAVAAPRAARAIRSAGLTLAASFALLAIVPVLAFREFAIAMALGVLLETFVVRSLLVPGLVALVGYRSGWPGRRLRRGAERRRVAAATAPADERQ